MAGRVGGLISVEANGTTLRAKGNWTIFGLADKREGVYGADTFHGYKEMPQARGVEGTITDSADLNLTEFFNITNGTVRVQLANGKSYSVFEAFYVGDAGLETEEGEVKVRFEGARVEEVA